MQHEVAQVSVSSYVTITCCLLASTQGPPGSVRHEARARDAQIWGRTVVRHGTLPMGAPEVNGLRFDKQTRQSNSVVARRVRKGPSGV